MEATNTLQALIDTACALLAADIAVPHQPDALLSIAAPASCRHHHHPCPSWPVAAHPSLALALTSTSHSSA